MKNKNKIRITGVFLLAIASLSMMIILAGTHSQAATKDSSYMTSENIVEQDRLHGKFWEDDRLYDKFWEDDRLYNQVPKYEYGIGGFGDIGVPTNLPF